MESFKITEKLKEYLLGALVFGVMFSFSSLAFGQVSCSGLFSQDHWLDETAIRKFKLSYQRGSCHTNIANFLEKTKTFKDAKVMILYSKNPYEQLHPQNASEKTMGWRFHVVLLVNDKVVDFSYKSNEVALDLETYIHTMFGNQNIPFENIVVRFVEPQDYLNTRLEKGKYHYLYEIMDSGPLDLMTLIRQINPSYTQEFIKPSVSEATIKEHQTWTPEHIARKNSLAALARFAPGQRINLKYWEANGATKISGVLLEKNDRFIALDQNGRVIKIPAELVITGTKSL